MKSEVEQVRTYLQMKGHIRVFEKDNPKKVYLDLDNVICQTTSSLAARLFAGNTNLSLGFEPAFGIWGLAVGSGNPSWPSNSQPDATATQTALFAEVLRKRCSFIRFVDANLNPVTGYSNTVDFQTTLNATTDNITVPLRELGLIGGGSTSQIPTTNMLTAPYWVPPDPANPQNNWPAVSNGPGNPDSVTLINYKTLNPLVMPSGVSLIFAWSLSF